MCHCEERSDVAIFYDDVMQVLFISSFLFVIFLGLVNQSSIRAL